MVHLSPEVPFEKYSLVTSEQTTKYVYFKRCAFILLILALHYVCYDRLKVPPALFKQPKENLQNSLLLLNNKFMLWKAKNNNLYNAYKVSIVNLSELGY